MAKLNTTTQLDVTNKMSLSTGSSTNDKNYFEELYPWAPQLDLTDMFGEDVPWANDIVQANANAAAYPAMLQKINDFQLTEMPASNGQGYAMYSIPGNVNSPRYRFLISPAKFGYGYTFSLKDGLNNPIALTDGAYQFDHNNGFLRFDDANTPALLGWVLPLQITVFRYIGKFAKDRLDAMGGFWRPPVQVTDETVQLTLPTANPLTIDGYTILNGDAVLFTKVTNPLLNNRVYLADTTGPLIVWTLRTDGVAGDGSPTAGEQMVSIFGLVNAGMKWGFNGTNWIIVASGSFNLTLGNTSGSILGSWMTEMRIGTNATPNIYIDATKAYHHVDPPPDPMSGNLTINKTLYTGRLSCGNAFYPPTLNPGDPYDRIVNIPNATMTFSHIATAYRWADVGNLIALVNAIAIANLDNLANFEEANRSGNQIMTNWDIQGTGDPVADATVPFVGGAAGYGDLQVLSVNWTAFIGASLFQKGLAELHVTSTSLWQQGYNSVLLRHRIGLANWDSNTFGLFFDDDAGADPSVSGADLTVNTPAYKYLSGVQYFGSGSTFDYDGTVNDGFDNVYHISGAPVVLSGFPGVASAAIMYNNAYVVPATSDPPCIGETMAIVNYPFTLPANLNGVSVRVTATPRDPYGNYVPVLTPEYNYTYMTYGNVATRTMEYFRDENWRFPNNTDFNVVPGSLTGNWDSTISLTSATPGYTTSLQVFEEVTAPNNILYHPQRDYSTRLPASVDYTGLAAGTLYNYYRIFQGVIDNSNGQLRVPGLQEADLTGGTPNVRIWIKVPTKTMWLSLNADYNMGTFNVNALYPTGTDGEGCRINKTTHYLTGGGGAPDGILEFTLGPYASDVGVNRTLWVFVQYASGVIPRWISGTPGFGIINW